MSLNDTLETILVRYEQEWRRAMLADKPQTHDPMKVENGNCAWLVMKRAATDALVYRQAQGFALRWDCPECGERCRLLSTAMVHLNDVHGWTWDMFANKFRDALSRGAAPEAQPRQP